MTDLLDILGYAVLPHGLLINPAMKQVNPVMPDLIPAKDGIFDRHPVPVWIPASAGMTKWMYFVAGVI